MLAMKSKRIDNSTKLMPFRHPTSTFKFRKAEFRAPEQAKHVDSSSTTSTKGGKTFKLVDIARMDEWLALR